MPILLGGQIINKIHQHEYSRQQRLAEYDDAVGELKTNVSICFSNLRTLKAVILAQSEAVSAARLSLVNAKREYIAGKLLADKLVSAQHMLTEAQTSLITSLLQYIKIWAQLNSLAGSLNIHAISAINSVLS